MFQTSNRKKMFILISGDCFMIVLSLLLSSFFYFGNFIEALLRCPWSVGIITAVYMFSFYIFDLYEDYRQFNRAYFFSRFIIAVFFGAFITLIFPHLCGPLRFKHNLLLFIIFYILIMVPLWRLIFDVFLMSALGRKRGVIVGAGHSGRYIGDVLNGRGDFEVVGFVDDDVTKQGQMIHGIKVLGGADTLKEMAKKGQVDFAVVAITHEKSPELLDALFSVKMNYVEINDVAEVYEKIMGKLSLSHLRQGWVVFSKFSSLSNRWLLPTKRCFDIVLSILGFILFLPIILLVAIAVRVDSRGPVIYKQFRVGQNGKVFVMYKFRSMILGSEKDGDGIYTSINDPRITRVGRLIRKARFDELPQLWNILRGDMSIVGPRPEALELAKKYKKEIPYYALRYVVKPGLTGWAQVRYAYSASLETASEKFKYDMFYLKNVSIFMDIQIILKTVSVLVYRDFSR